MNNELDKLMNAHANGIKTVVLNWVAMDSSGEIYAYENRPRLDGMFYKWKSNCGMSFRIGYTEDVKLIEHWKESLRKIER